LRQDCYFEDIGHCVASQLNTTKLKHHSYNNKEQSDE